VPSDSTQAMASLMSAYGDEEADDDAAHDTSGMSAAQPDDEAASSPDTRTQQPGANFISDDEDAHQSPQDVDDKSDKQDTRSPAAERRPLERTSKCVRV